MLKEIQQKNQNFSGIGVIITDNLLSLPIYPLRASTPDFSNKNNIDFLQNISNYQSDYHDGFHILDSNLQIKKISQYFSPPIPNDFTLTRQENFGGRYLAALFGSTLPNVQFTAINSNNSGIAIFKNGQEIYSEE